MWVVIIAGLIAFTGVWIVFRIITNRLAGGLIPMLLVALPIAYCTPSGCHKGDMQKLESAVDDIKKQARENP